MHVSESTTKCLTLSLKIKTNDVLYKAYMPFITNGGLFIPTTNKFTLNQEIYLHLQLPDTDTEYQLPGMIVWLTPTSAEQGWKPGIGIQFLGEQASEIRVRIEQLLEGLLSLGEPTNTL